MVITGLTRNQFDGNVTWVRIPPAPPTKTLSPCGRAFYVDAGGERTHVHVANEGSVSPVGSAEGKRPEFVSAKRASSAPQAREATIERTGLRIPTQAQ